MQPQPGNYPVQPQGSYPVGPQGHANPVIVTSQAPQNGNPVIISVSFSKQPNTFRTSSKAQYLKSTCKLKLYIIYKIFF